MAATSKPKTSDSANGTSVMDSVQDAADYARNTAERAAARLPEVAANAQGAARDTQKALDQMPNQALLIGTSLSLGFAGGLFLAGTNRLLVAIAAAPAIAMGLTMMNRDQTGAASAD
jgi:hypothetical protein